MPIYNLSPKAILFGFKLPITICSVVKHRFYRIDSTINCAWLNYYILLYIFRQFNHFCAICIQQFA